MATIQDVKNKIQNLITLANEKTSNNDTDLTNAINKLIEGYGVGSGGSSANVVNVNFHNCDETLLYTKPTIKGDDCVDVIVKGLLATPTKESSNTLNYSFSGWSIANDDTVDSDVLATVNEDRNVYACYNSSTRYYTVRFYSDGALVDTVQVQYGGTASHKSINKDGYKIGGYTPSNENITSDVDINIDWIVDDGIIYDDWDVISAYCDDGSYSTRYKVGDRKNLEINYSDGTSEIIPMKIVQMDSTYDRHVDDYANKYAKLVFMAENILKDNYAQAFGSTNYWKDTSLAQYLNNTLITYLPQSLQDVVVDVGVGSTYGISDARQKGKLWIPSTYERLNYHYNGSNNFYYTPSNMETQYDAFDGETISSYTRYTKVGEDTITPYLFRTIHRTSNVYNFIYDSPDGSSLYYDSNNSLVGIPYTSNRGILLGFCIG